ncbi:MAG: hypothetical protein DRJ37_02335 [Thermoprotei archaeon]|nr:MAG: hypothetical protein DRJ37_02335 [Thermoprotei archaeon]
MRKSIVVFLILALSLTLLGYSPKISSISIYTKTLYPVIDGHICPDIAKFNVDFISVAYFTGSNTRCNILMKFDLSAIPKGAKIISAKLYVYLKKFYTIEEGKTYKKVNLGRITSYWTSSATYEYRTSTLKWDNPGGDYVPLYKFVNVYIDDPQGKQFEYDVTGVVKDWMNNEYPNYGFIFYAGESWTGGLQFYAREAPNPDYRPKLVIKYQYGIDVDVNPSILEVAQGKSGTYAVTISTVGYSGNVNLQLSGLPSGATYSFSPSSGVPPFNSFLTINVGSDTQEGTYTLTIKAVGTGVSAQKTVKLKVKGGAFTLSLASPSISLQQGETEQVQLVVNPVGEYSKKVTITFQNVPAGVSVTASPAQVYPGSIVVVTISISENAAPGTYHITVKGTGEDGKTDTTILDLTITEMPFEFSISASPPSATVAQGEKVSTVIEIGLTSGHPKPVSITVSGLPSGTYALSSTSVTPPGKVYLKIDTSTLSGTYTVVIEATGDGISKTTQFVLNVKEKPPFDFNLIVTPTTVDMKQGETTSIIIQVEVISGEPEEVTLSVIGLPPEASYTLSPDKLIPPGTAVLMVDSGSAKGTFTIIIKAESSESEKTQLVTLNIEEKLCIIATVTYGSEVSDEVNFLREFRDNIVLSTTAGKMFYKAFNAFYYSWSPYVAQFILRNPILKTPMRVLLYPLIGSLMIASYIATPLTAVSPEIAVYLAGIISSLLLGLIYLTPLTYIVLKLSKRKIKPSVVKLFCTSFITILVMCLLSQLMGVYSMLIITTPLLVINTMLLPALLLSHKLIK